jgi:DNA polymerase-1
MGTTRAATGRINHKNPNLGNIPARSTDGQLVQAGFIAPPGRVLVARDLSQIEMRDLAHLANCKSMIDAYHRDVDLHDMTARKVFKLPESEKPDKTKHRMAAKRVGFGIQNGTTEKGLYLQLVTDYGANGLPIPDWLTEDWCKWFIGQFLESYPEIPEFFDLCWYRARRYGMSWEPFGRVRLVPEVRSTHSWIRDAGLRQAQNMPVTSCAAGQLKLGMGKADRLLKQLYDSGIWCWPLLTIHDAIKTEADEKYADEVEEILAYSLDTCMVDEHTGEHRFRVPIKSDGEATERWCAMWDRTKKYGKGSVVSCDRIVYLAREESTGIKPPYATFWESIAA